MYGLIFYSRTLKEIIFPFSCIEIMKFVPLIAITKDVQQDTCYGKKKLIKPN